MQLKFCFIFPHYFETLGNPLKLNWNRKLPYLYPGININNSKVYVMNNICKGCKTCVTVCPNYAMEFDENKKNPGKPPALFFFALYHVTLPFLPAAAGNI
jgi:ferredoxin